MKILLAATLSVFFMVPTAFADSTSHRSHFVSLDRAGIQSEERGSLSVLYHENFDFPQDSFARLNFHIQRQTNPASALYLNVPVSIAFFDGEEKHALGGIEIGRQFKLPFLEGSLFIRTSGILPTAADGLESFVINANANYTRLTDLVQAFPKTTSLRLAGSYAVEKVGHFAQVDIGVDLPIQTNGEFGEVPDPLYHLNLGVGMKGENMNVVGEFVTVIPGDTDRDELLHTLGGAVFFNTAKRTQTYVSANLLLDSFFEDNDTMYSFIVGLRSQ